MPTANLTARFIETLVFPQGRPANSKLYYWDQKERGLGVAIYPRKNELAILAPPTPL